MVVRVPGLSSKRSLCILIIGLIPSLFLFPEYPVIGSLTPGDVLFVQLQRDIESYHRAAAKNKTDQMPPLAFFVYRTKHTEDLLFLAARLNLPYETLSTLNCSDSKEGFDSLDSILIPNIPGIFVPTDPRNDLEQIMFSWRSAENAGAVSVTVSTDKLKRRFIFFPGDRFHPVERAYFLQILFRSPLPGGRITSRFGIRRNPFGGHTRFHNGIDLAAPTGTEVLAAREGTVKETGFDEVFGRYVLVEHTNGYETLYGHLNSIEVSLNHWVNSGKIIGTVGSTGISTGPHLHFEIRRKGVARDPVPLLPHDLKKRK
jgi:murein DD-endopeptidase MepM/ murein hydrolase activator NlpD